MRFSTLLIANRGEIARRVMRTAKEMGLHCVAVYVDADADAPFVRDAHEAIRLRTGYMDADAIIAAATMAGAEAVHPGYGFLSENAAFATRVEQAGLIWVGPPAAAIAAVGDKLAAKALAEKVGVPTLAYSDDPASATSVGFPILVKAAAGGGGKGMRIVTTPADLDEAVATAKREALAGFGDDTVFLEHYVGRSRHVEIQILGDTHGSIVHLGERECSIQRRHQKLVEESPSVVVDGAMREAMGDAALTLAREIGYYSTGTVEFLVDDATHEFFFLEVNTRLQVEHPVTEEITGLDLVREQLRIASGEPLGFSQRDISFTGHAIEIRLCAEDPSSGFLPATGVIDAFCTPDEPVVRWESGIERGSVVGVSFDPLLAKVIAHGPNREEAATRLAVALEGLHLGGVTTNRDFLVATLRHPAFLAGDTTTSFIEIHNPDRLLSLDDGELLFSVRAAALWLQGEHRRQAGVLGDLPSGWRNARLPDQSCVLRCGESDVIVSYVAQRDGSFRIDGAHARVHHHDERGLDIEIDDRRVRLMITRAGEDLYVQTRHGTLTLAIVPLFRVPGNEHVSGGLVAPMPGTVLDVRVKAGDHVTKGTTLVVLEAMKMEHHISAPSDGVVVDVLIGIGEQVANGAPLLIFEDGTDETSDG